MPAASSIKALKVPYLAYAHAVRKSWGLLPCAAGYLTLKVEHPHEPGWQMLQVSTQCLSLSCLRPQQHAQT